MLRKARSSMAETPSPMAFLVVSQEVVNNNNSSSVKVEGEAAVFLGEETSNSNSEVRFHICIQLILVLCYYSRVLGVLIWAFHEHSIGIALRRCMLSLYLITFLGVYYGVKAI